MIMIRINKDSEQLVGKCIPKRRTGVRKVLTKATAPPIPLPIPVKHIIRTQKMWVLQQVQRRWNFAFEEASITEEQFKSDYTCTDLHVGSNTIRLKYLGSNTALKIVIKGDKDYPEVFLTNEINSDER